MKYNISLNNRSGNPVFVGPAVDANGDTTGNFGMLISVNAVPEPGSIALMGSGLVGLLGYSMRRRMQACL